MALSLEDIRFLISPRGEQLLDWLRAQDLSESQILPLLTQMRRSYEPAEAGAALSMARLRLKAAEKFGDAAQSLLFEENALQQASDPLVRQYRAAQIAATANVIDACCGIGADSISYARQVRHVLGVDIDPVRLAIAEHNARMLSISNLEFVNVDVRDGLPSAEADVIFFDPARRDEQGRRIFDVERYAPPLRLVNDWYARLIIVKLSPGVDLAQLEPYAGHLEFISVAGDLKEAVFRLGQGASSPSATLLTGGQAHHWLPSRIPAESLIRPPQGWLHEPDPAIIRAGLVADLAHDQSGAQVDEMIAYFTTPDQVDSPWVRSWQILDWIPFNLKKLKSYLKVRAIGHVTIKKRGFPMTPDELEKRLKLRGENSCTLVLTQYAGQHIVIVCADYGVSEKRQG